jgi:hypothetical protein
MTTPRLQIGTQRYLKAVVFSFDVIDLKSVLPTFEMIHTLIPVLTFVLSAYVIMNITFIAFTKGV